MNQKFKEATPILKKLISEGYEAYFVGGSVRDYLLEKEINDIDITSSATPDEVMSIFPKHVPVGVEHGTVIVIDNGSNYEITTFRTESAYVDYRRPSEVKFVRLLEEDLKRRDFTINALAMSESGEIIDLFNGKEDLQKKLIRTVGNPNDRFLEDALRMMRGLRFVSQLGFSLEEETMVSIKYNAKHLEKISIERITIEFEKLLMGEYLLHSIPNLVDSNLIQFLPGMVCFEEKMIACKEYDFMKLQSLVERWALLILILDIKDTWDFLKGWKLSRKQMIAVKNIVEGVKYLKDWTKWVVYKNGIQLSCSIEKVSSIYFKQPDRLHIVEQLFNELPMKQSSEICLNGNDLMEWYQLKPGSWIADCIESIEKDIVNGILLNTKEDIKEAVNNGKYRISSSS